MPLNEYQVVGKKLEEDRLFRMRLFAPNEVVAVSRFWYFLKQFQKVKKASGQVVSVNQIFEKSPNTVKNFGIWIRYNSRSGTHNMYKEYRSVSRADAVQQCYLDMASKHRARFSSIQIIKVNAVSAKDVKRPYMKQLIEPQLKFPLPHTVTKREKSRRALFVGKRPNTF